MDWPEAVQKLISIYCISIVQANTALNTVSESAAITSREALAV